MIIKTLHPNTNSYQWFRSASIFGQDLARVEHFVKYTPAHPKDMSSSFILCIYILLDYHFWYYCFFLSFVSDLIHCNPLPSKNTVMDINLERVIKRGSNWWPTSSCCISKCLISCYLAFFYKRSDKIILKTGFVCDRLILLTCRYQESSYDTDKEQNICVLTYVLMGQQEA